MSYKNTNLCSDFAICEAFNEFFASAYKKDNEPLNVPSENFFPEIYLSDIFVSQCEILDELSKCKSGANSVEGISPNILILVLQFCLNDIVELFNCIVSNEQFPNIWKTAHINPLHKKVSRMNIENYRPMSTLLALALIFERVLYNKVKMFNQRNL